MKEFVCHSIRLVLFFPEKDACFVGWQIWYMSQEEDLQVSEMVAYGIEETDIKTFP